MTINFFFKMTELTQLIDKEIPDGRQSLQENFTNLERLAQYCQENYNKVIVQKMGSYFFACPVSIRFLIFVPAIHCIWYLCQH